MSVYIIPLTPAPQNFGIVLAGVTYNLTVKWNTVAQCWVMDIADQNSVKILSGVPIITGADLLEQYAYFNFGGKLIAQTDGDLQAVPTFENLGVQGKLYFVTS
jgi:hypothetical protein